MADAPHPSDAIDKLSIDFLRGMVCLGVVIFHLYVWVQDQGLNTLFGSAGSFVVIHLRFGFESFFVLAGFFVAHMFRPGDGNSLSVLRFLVRRFVRLAVPYWAAVGLVVAAGWVAHLVFSRDNHPHQWSDVLLAFGFVQDVFGDKYPLLFPLWSMAPLLQYYLVWSVAFWLIRSLFLAFARDRFQALTRLAMIGLTSAAFAAAVALHFVGEVPALGQWQLPYVAWALTLGSIAYWSLQRGRFVRLILGLAMAAVVGSGLALEDVLFVKAAAFAVLLLAVGHGLTLPRWLPVRAVAYLGGRSYSVYLIHGFVGLRLLSWWEHLGVDEPLVLFLWLMLAVAASIASGLLFFVLVERPARRLSNRIEYRR